MSTAKCLLQKVEGKNPRVNNFAVIGYILTDAQSSASTPTHTTNTNTGQHVRRFVGNINGVFLCNFKKKFFTRTTI